SDTKGMYDTIKDMIKKYSEMVNKLDKMYAAEDGSKYKMLTDDEKKAMSETEVKDWENKIKDSLLRRDMILQTTVSALSDVMISTIKVQTREGEKELQLSHFGINTQEFDHRKDNEWHAYHINGDEDDDMTKEKENLLKKMISTDPDATASFFRNLSVNLAERLHGLMGSTEYSSSYTLYEDKLMASQYSSYASKIFDATRTLNAKQDNYYKKFARMEKAMAQLNSTQNQLAGYFNTK
ncbi:MAG: flagellar filament capping protein FliD, partial [Lachnospiraceae bacterium]|nr:flagellar filament capping protein FliD [Lachnospiraceae bacterium]